MRRILLLILLACIGLLTGAEFKVTGELENAGLGYITNNVRDTDGIYCAKVQINSDIRGMKFDSKRKPVKIEREIGKYFVYLSPGERSLSFSHADYAYKEYEFPLTLEANTAYVMTVVRSGYVSADEGLVTITFVLNEQDVYISRGDNPPILSSQNSAQYRLAPGVYKYKFQKQGFEEKELELTFDKDERIAIDLEKGTSITKMKLGGFVVIKSQPEKADVYLNDQKVGATPNQFDLIAGEYILTIKADMYHSRQQEFTLEEGETLELPLIELQPKYGFWQVECRQQAEIFLDDVLVGTGQIARQQIESGNHKLTVKLDYYHEYEEEFLISDGDIKDFEIGLKPAFGVLEIKSTPVTGAKIYINDEYIGTTPFKDNKRPSGQYKLKVEKDLYIGTEETVIVKDEELTQKTILLTQDFGILKVKAEGSEIYLNEEKVGTGNYQANLQAGNYEVEARRDRHRADSRKVYLGVGKEEEIELTPEPIMGSVSVMSNPPASKGAAIWVNGEKEKKTTPAVLPLLIGQYSIKLSHPDFLEQVKMVNLEEGEQKKLEFELETYQGSMLSKRNRWNRNGWIGCGTTVLTIGAGLLFNSMGDGYADDYTVAESTQEIDAAWDDMESSYNMRDTCFYVSIVPAVYMIYSWVKAGRYHNKLKMEN